VAPGAQQEERRCPPHSQLASLNPSSQRGLPHHASSSGTRSVRSLDPIYIPGRPIPIRRHVPGAESPMPMRAAKCAAHLAVTPHTPRDIRRAFTAAAARIQLPPPSPPKSPRSSHSPLPSPTTGTCHRYLFRPRSAPASRSSVAEQRSVGGARQIRARRHADLRSPDGERTERRHCSRPRASSCEWFRWGWEQGLRPGPDSSSLLSPR
jgi:hypothetical protein